MERRLTDLCIAYHDAVKNALIQDGWTITHDPLKLPWGRSRWERAAACGILTP